MKITPVAQSSGQPGESLTSTNVGRTADPMKLERARAIARGEKVPDISQTTDPQANRIQDVRKLKMKTNYSTDRDIPPVEAATEAAPTPAAEAAEAESSTSDTTEQATLEVTEPLSPQFAALAKQKRALQVKERELLEREKALSERGTAPQSDELLNRLKSEPLSVLQEYGVLTPDFYNSFTEFLVSGNGQINPEVQALKAEIKAIKEGVEKNFQTREEQAEEAALTEMLYEAERLAKEGDDFEMVRTEEAYDQVLRLIHKTYKDTGRVMDVREALEAVENRLFARAEKLASTNKLKSKFAPQLETPQLQSQQRPQGMRTLTARDTATPVSDRRARAIAAFQGMMKR